MGQLEAVGINTIDDLPKRTRMRPEGLQVINERARGDKILADNPLCSIAADVCTEIRVRLPEMTPLYYPNWRDVSPAKPARMSVEVPYFFEPVEVPLHRDNADKSAWLEEAAFPGEVIKQHEAAGKPWLPRRALFVAGGILSNSPSTCFMTTPW